MEDVRYQIMKHSSECKFNPDLMVLGLILLLFRILISFFRITRFSTFPDYLVIQLQKFTISEDWTPKKLGKLLLVGLIYWLMLFYPL